MQYVKVHQILMFFMIFFEQQVGLEVYQKVYQKLNTNLFNLDFNLG